MEADLPPAAVEQEAHGLHLLACRAERGVQVDLGPQLEADGRDITAEGVSLVALALHGRSDPLRLLPGHQLVGGGDLVLNGV